MNVLHVLSAFVAVASCGQYGPRKPGRCEPITISLCKDMPYNVTRMPNIVGHETQEEAALLLRHFTPLIESDCSSRLRFFLCSLFVPLCSEKVDAPIPSCQSLCFEVKDKCLPLLQSVKMPWPQVLNCSQLPREKASDDLCMSYPRDGEPARRPPSGRVPQLDAPYLMAKYPRRDWDGLLPGGRAAPPPGWPALPHDCRPACGAEVLFTTADRQLTELWMTVLATLCFLSTLFTVLTFWIDTTRFKYPERPIVFISMCYNIYSLGYLLRMFLGTDHVICDVTSEGERYLIDESLDGAGCIVTFLLLYYFGLASNLWWVALTFTWFLSAGRKWSSEAIQHYATHLHAVAWGVPAVLTLVIITAQTISGDELTGLCYVSSRQLPLLTLVVAPLALLLLTGALFLTLGYAALVNIRRRMRLHGTNTHKLETLMVRIGVYGLLYMAPATCVVACYLYEYVHWDTWRARALHEASQCVAGGTCPLQASIPPISVFMLKLFMSLVVGVVSGVWIWTAKTANSWHRFCGELCCGRRRHGAKGGACRASEDGNGTAYEPGGFGEDSSRGPRGGPSARDTYAVRENARCGHLRRDQRLDCGVPSPEPVWRSAESAGQNSHAPDPGLHASEVTLTSCRRW
ncbi:frizzled-9-like [Pollicipes pollicipes]|uniref:frizzled-9-like n=1 Tax=Pollicipes pollicipes TaxID=41117 RepID=UPI0018849723|nr:frizzled-9-like [Pollicipes pollicipes]